MAAPEKQPEVVSAEIAALEEDEFWDEEYIKLAGAEDYEREATPEFLGEPAGETENLTALKQGWEFSQKTPDQELKVEKGTSKKPKQLKPRSYQEYIFEKAKERNTILHMNTGLGKTLCSVMLINHYLEEDDGRLIFFLAPQVPLVNQHAAYIQMQCPKAEVRRLHGQMDVGHESWDHNDWVSILRAGGNVFVMTAGMLHHMLVHAHILITDIKLLIVDECHHAGALDEFSLIMNQHYARVGVPNRPRIFAMSAPLVTGNVEEKEMKKRIKGLEKLYDAVLVQPLEDDIKDWDKEPDISYLKYVPEDEEIFEERYGIMWPDWGENAIQWIKIQNDWRAVLEELGQQSAVRCMDRFISFRHRDSNLHRAQSDTGTITPLLKTKLEKHQSFVDSKAELTIAWANFREHPDHVHLKRFTTSNKVETLIQCLRDFKSARAGIQDKCIILCERRVVAEYLARCLQEEFHTAAGAELLVHYIISSSRSGIGLSSSMKQDDQKRILRGFRSLEATDPNRVDVIVATSILEEGIDIPTCKLVIRFNPSSTPKTDIQSAGRARAIGSKYVHMVSNEKEEESVEKILSHQAKKKFIFDYANFRQRDVENWKPRKMKNLNDYPGALYNEKTCAFLTEEMAYRKIHETYTRFDREIDYQIQWKHFAETPFNKWNFQHMTGPSVTGNWLLTAVDGENTNFKFDLSLKHSQTGSNFDGVMHLEINGEKFECKVKGKYNSLRKGTISIPELGRGEFSHEWTEESKRKGERVFTSLKLNIHFIQQTEYELDDESMFTIPQFLTFSRTETHAPNTFEHKRKRKRRDYHSKHGKYRRFGRSKIELIHRSIVTLPAIIPSSQRPPMEEEVVAGPIRFTTKSARGAVSAVAMQKLFNRGILDDRFCVRGRNLRLNVVGMAAHDDDPVEFVERHLPPLFSFAEKENPYAYYLHEISIEALDGEFDPHFSVLLPKPCHQSELEIFPIDEVVAGKTQKCIVRPIREIVLTSKEIEDIKEFHKVFLMCVEVKPQFNKKEKEPIVAKDCLIVPVKQEDPSEIDFERVLHIGSQGTDYMEWRKATDLIGEKDIGEYIVRTTYAYYYYTLIGVNENINVDSEMVEGLSFRDHYDMHHGVDIEDDDAPMIDASGYIVKAYNAMAVPQEHRIEKKVLHLVPELCAVLPLKQMEHKYARYYPSILWRLECLDVIRMAKDKIQEYTGENIAYPLLYQSLTTPAVDHEPDMNYNRAEFMGDSILLWLVARLAYNLYPNASPIELTTHVNKRISNEFLAEQIKKVDVSLHEYIIGERFARKRWCAPGVPVANHLREQELSRNTVADVHEALIYASFINDVARQFLGVDDDSPFTDCRRLKEFQRSNPSEAFVQPTDLETLNSCLENAERFITKMMKLPPCELLEYENLPELPIETENAPACIPPTATKEAMEFCEGYLRTIDPFLERHPRNLAGENDPNRNLEEMIDDKYSSLSEPMSPAKPRRQNLSPNTSPSKVRSQRHVEPTILASGVEVVPNTTLPVPSKENMVKTVVLRSKKAQKIPLDHDFHMQLEEKLAEMFTCEDADLVLSYRRIWSDGGFNCEKGEFETDEIFYRKIRRALLRTKSLHQAQFASRVTRNEANLSAIERMLGYSFNNRDLLLQAFIHTSINPNLKKCHTYQRMEFLGDAALGFMTSLSLFREYPEWEEGHMSHAKSAIVSNSYFARKLYRRFIAAGLKLEDYIVTKSEEIREGIREFQAVFNPDDDDLVYSLQINMTPRNERDGQAYIFPKILGDCYESIAAAILIDSDWNLVQMWEIMRADLLLSEKQIQILDENMLALKEIDVDKAKTNLQKFFNQ